MTVEYPSTRHFEATVTDRVVEEPWALAKVRAGEKVLDIGSATSRYLRDLAARGDVYAIDLRPTPSQPGVQVMLGDLIHAPFIPGSFDVVTCISTIEHVGLDVYGQGPDEFGDEVALRHIRTLLRPGGRLLLTAPIGRRAVSAWHRIYDRASFRRAIGGYRLLSVEHYRREGDAYLPCRREEIDHAGFDFPNMRSNGVVLAELTPVGGLGFVLSRLLLRVRRTVRRLTLGGAPFWEDPQTGESAVEWFRKRDKSRPGDPRSIPEGDAAAEPDEKQ